jgi:D-alanine transaminase
MQRISYLNGEFLPHEKCFVHIEDRGFQFADGVYEVTLFENNKLIDGEPHAQRMLRNLTELSIKHKFTSQELQQIQLDLFAKNPHIKSGICYIQITRGVANRTPSCPREIKPTISATVAERKIFSEQELERGINILIHEDIRWHRCDIKTVGLLASTLVNQKAKDLGFDDAIFVRSGIVTEATYANVFIVDKNDNLITHPVDNHILCGITRNRLIEIARQNNIKIIERKFSVEELLTAKEVLLTSSSLIIRPAAYINGIEIDNSKNNRQMAKFLTKKYQEFIKSSTDEGESYFC